MNASRFASQTGAQPHQKHLLLGKGMMMEDVIAAKAVIQYLNCNTRRIL